MHLYSVYVCHGIRDFKAGNAPSFQWENYGKTLCTTNFDPTSEYNTIGSLAFGGGGRDEIVRLSKFQKNRAWGRGGGAAVAVARARSHSR